MLSPRTADEGVVTGLLSTSCDLASCVVEVSYSPLSSTEESSLHPTHEKTSATVKNKAKNLFLLNHPLTAFLIIPVDNISILLHRSKQIPIRIIHIDKFGLIIPDKIVALVILPVIVCPTVV